MRSPFLQITVNPPGADWPPGYKQLLWIGGGLILVSATGGVAAGVVLSGGSWAVFGAGATTAATTAAKWVGVNAARASVVYATKKMMDVTVFKNG